VAKSERALWLAQSKESTGSRPATVASRATPVTSETERELAEIAAAQIDRAAFAPLYERYVDLVWRYALSRLGDRERAADATSQTFQRALAALPNYRPHRRGDGTTFRSWLMAIARNVVIDEQRRVRPATPLDDPAAGRWLVDDARGPEAHAVAADERRRVNDALAQLPDAQRQIVELRLLGLKGREIAGLLDMTESAVKTAHFRAIARLRDLLNDADDEGRTQ
jgi:RNA polymerase sigma-70 factor (ECF subfamily)